MVKKLNNSGRRMAKVRAIKKIRQVCQLIGKKINI